MLITPSLYFTPSFNLNAHQLVNFTDDVDRIELYRYHFYKVVFGAPKLFRVALQYFTNLTLFIMVGSCFYIFKKTFFFCRNTRKIIITDPKLSQSPPPRGGGTNFSPKFVSFYFLLFLFFFCFYFLLLSIKTRDIKITIPSFTIKQVFHCLLVL